MSENHSIASRLIAAVVVASGLIASGCDATPSASPTADRGSVSAAQVVSVTPADRAGTFCQALAHVGVVDTDIVEDSKDTATMLPALDALVSTAPDDIAADFAVFDQVEHAMLDPGSGPQHANLDNPGTREALQHFAAYLHATCHLT